MSRGEYRFAGPRAEWLKIHAMRQWPQSKTDTESVLEFFGVNPSWLDQTFENRGKKWRVEGLHCSYRWRRPMVLSIIAEDGAQGTIVIHVLKRLLKAQK